MSEVLGTIRRKWAETLRQFIHGAYAHLNIKPFEEKHGAKKSAGHDLQKADFFPPKRPRDVVWLPQK